MSNPLVSVVMAVYNGQEYLNIAIDSILQQTYDNLELIIIDDGSHDNSASIIYNYSDPRIHYVYQDNRGLAPALNHGIRIAQGDYIARMDCDDISYPTRLAEQVSFLEKNNNFALVGTSYDLIDWDGRIIDRSIHLDLPEDLKLEFLVRNPFGHGTVMIRKTALETTGIYDSTQSIEDYEFWWRISQRYPVANIPKQLYGWRVNPESISHKGDKSRQFSITSLMQTIWTHQSRLAFSKPEIIARFKHYSSIGDKYKDQYIYFLAALCIALNKRHRRLEAGKLTLILASLPGGWAALKDVKKHPRSHNYNLVNIGPS